MKSLSDIVKEELKTGNTLIEIEEYPSDYEHKRPERRKTYSGDAKKDNKLRQKQREILDNIPEHTKRLHRYLSKITHRIGIELMRQNVSEDELASILNMDKKVVYRMLAGGIDFNMSTLREIERVFDIDFINVNEIA